MPVSINKIFDIRGRVIAPTSQALSLDLLSFSKSDLIPSNCVMEFDSYQDVLNYFMDSSLIEVRLASIYFKGFDGTIKIPKKLLMSKWLDATSPAIIISQSLPSLDYIKTQGTAGFKVSVTKVDGSMANVSITGIDLSTINSLSGLGNLIAEKINSETGETSISSTYNLFNNQLILQTIGKGADESISPFTAPDSGVDLGALIGLDNPSIISNGSDVKTTEESVAKAINCVSDFVAFMSFFNMSDATTVEAVTYLDSLDDDFVWYAQTLNSAALTSGDTTALAYLVKDYKNVYVQYGTLENTVFAASIGACIDFSNGTVLNWSFKSQTGLIADVTTDNAFNALLANGYNFYATYGLKASTDNFLYNGKVTGIYNYIDALYSAMWLKDSLQRDLVQLFTTSTAISYTQQGYALVKASLQNTINQALENQVISIGIILSNAQKIQIAQELGQDVSSTLESNGYLLIVDDPGAEVRINRGSPICKLFYTYGGAINKIVLDSVQVQ